MFFANSGRDELRRGYVEAWQRQRDGLPLTPLQAQEPRAYKLILGDACHAYRGLRFWS